MRKINFKKFGQKVSAAAALVGAAVVSSPAFAALDISAETTAAKTDIASAGALIVGVVVAVAAFAWIRRVIK